MRKRPLLLVEWEDIAAHTSWEDENGDYKNKTIHCVSVGWRLKSDRKSLVVAATRSSAGTCSDRTAIPKGCIKSIRRLE